MVNIVRTKIFSYITFIGFTSCYPRNNSWDNVYLYYIMYGYTTVGTVYTRVKPMHHYESDQNNS